MAKYLVTGFGVNDWPESEVIVARSDEAAIKKAIKETSMLRMKIWKLVKTINK